MSYPTLVLTIVILVLLIGNRLAFERKRKARRDYYRNEYLKSEAWMRKRYVVLRRDNWRCVYCGAHATQVHHKKYAKKFWKGADQMACLSLQGLPRRHTSLAEIDT